MLDISKLKYLTILHKNKYWRIVNAYQQFLKLVQCWTQNALNLQVHPKVAFYVLSTKNENVMGTYTKL